MPADNQDFSVLKTQAVENEAQAHWTHRNLKRGFLGCSALLSPSRMATASLTPSRLPPPSASVSPLLHCQSCYLSSPLFTGVWRSVIKNAKHFEIPGRSMKEDLERVQPWNRKEIPACPLQLISYQAGAWDLITPIKFACITTNITGGGSDPTTLFTLCLTYCLCWGKENCNCIYWLTSYIKLPR